VARHASRDGAAAPRRATPADLPLILSLLRQANLSVAGVEDHLAEFLVAVEGDRIVGSAGLEVYGEAALLRSVAVAAPQRGRGLGARLVTAALARARHLGVREVALLTTSAAPFFRRFGFRDVDRQTLDPRLFASKALGEECCATAVGMKLRLRRGDTPVEAEGQEERA